VLPKKRRKGLTLSDEEEACLEERFQRIGMAVRPRPTTSKRTDRAVQWHPHTVGVIGIIAGWGARLWHVALCRR
jgi:hypothetical protein